MIVADVIGEVDDHRPDNFADHLVDEKVAISQYSLSASVACGKVRRRVLNHPSFRRLIVTRLVDVVLLRCRRPFRRSIVNSNSPLSSLRNLLSQPSRLHLFAVTTPPLLTEPRNTLLANRQPVLLLPFSIAISSLLVPGFLLLKFVSC